jgi:hypothetical protein
MTTMAATPAVSMTVAKVLVDVTGFAAAVERAVGTGPRRLAVFILFSLKLNLDDLSEQII